MRAQAARSTMPQGLWMRACKMEPQSGLSRPDLVEFSCWSLDGFSDGMQAEGKTRAMSVEFQMLVQALSQRPMGRQDSVWSQITRSVAVIGIASNRPMPPQTHPQNNNATVIATAFSRTRRPTSAGAMKFAATT